ncbi:MAG: hypothetical protein ACW98U_13585 [Candidatus Thorarchaeota archaeon]
MVSEFRLRLLAGGLLILSAFTHTLQVFVYGGVWHNIGAALYGAMYLFLGVGLIRFLDKKGLVALCVILPLIGGVGGVIRFFFLHTEAANLFIILHVLIDVVVVPACILIFRSMRTVKPGVMV